jgi:hypothetical protein
MKRKAKLIISCLCFMTLAIAMGTTLAFYSNRGGTIENVMSTKGSSVYLQELFNPEDYWLAGETKQKELMFGNQGERDQVIRFRIELQWINSSGGALEPITEAPVEIKWAEALTEEWVRFIDDNGWYYYEKILPAGGETAAVMESVTFSTKLSNDKQVEDFTHATYQIVVYMEALDVDSVITQAKWEKTFTVEEGLVWQD